MSSFRITPQGSKVFHHKVRSGCTTCKRRRIKCDEARPECSRCRASSLVCEGYDPPRAWVFEPSGGSISKSDFEQHLLSFSHGEGTRYMTLYARSTSSFFTTYAPQIAHIHPAAKHALLALSAQYQAILNHVNLEGSTELKNMYRTEALLHYNRGIKALSQTNEESVPLEVLVSCGLLFAGVELWPQKNMAPHLHIRHALRICQSVPSTTIHSDSMAGYLLRILLCLAENVASYHDNFTEASLGITEAYIDGAWLIPPAFLDAVEAEEHVDKLLKRVARLDCMSAGENIHRRHSLWEVHGQLSLAIDQSRRRTSRQTAFHHDMRSLQLHVRVIGVMLRTNVVQDEMAFDSCWEDFNYILSEVEELLAYELKPGSERGPTSVRSSLGLIPPMFLVATKCRDPVIRCRALELLHGSRRRERSWNSCVAFMMAQTVIDAEEGRPRDYQTPQTALPTADERVCLTHAAFDRTKAQITIGYTRAVWDASSMPEAIIKPWIPTIDDNYETVELSRKSLRAYGYTGTILISPRIACQCEEKEV